jgi:adenylate cyclase
MKEEIERKFLVKSEFESFAVQEIEIQQGYISTFPNTVRVRITDTKSFLTIKGESIDEGLSRPEWE